MNIDSCGHAWWHWLIGGLIILAAAALTVITAGGFAAAGTAFAGALGIGTATTAAGAAGFFAGLTVGIVSTSISGFIFGGISSAISGKNFWDGASEGFMWGAITGLFSGLLGKISFAGGEMYNSLGKAVGNVFQVAMQSFLSFAIYTIKSLIGNNKPTAIGAILSIFGGAIGGALCESSVISQILISLSIEMENILIEIFKKVTNIKSNNILKYQF